MIRHALRYAVHGWPVFALIGKVPPKDTEGVYAATTEPGAITKMFNRDGLNIGIALPGHVVVDIDIKHEGPAWLTEHRRQLHGLTLTCKTGGGGFHFYFELPPGELKGLICKGVDLRRGAGQYVVAPPSIHPVTGCQYEWIRSWPSKPQPVPPWLLEQIRRPEPARIPTREPLTTDYGVLIERARKYLEKCPPAISGQCGHVTTFETCLKLVGNFDLDPQTAFSLLLEWNRTCCPPWTEKEMRHKLRDALRTARGERAA